jgi:hypothetical protein
MPSNVITPPGLGQTYYGGNVPASTYWNETTRMEGIVRDFEDKAPKTAAGPQTERSALRKRCRYMRNASGFTVYGKFVVKHQAAYRDKRFAGLCAVDAEEVAGVVDENLPSTGCVDGDLCWVTQNGPTEVMGSLDANTISVDDWVIALTAATSNATTAGRVAAYAQSSSVTVESDQIKNRIGIAMSSRTAAQTNTAILVNMKIVV